MSNKIIEICANWRKTNLCRIAVIGAGGTGSMIVSGLVRMSMAMQALDGVELQIIVIDGDTVSPANVGRQLFYESDIGRNKAIALVNRYTITGMIRGDVLKASPRFIETTDNYLYHDIIIGCVDTANARRKIKTVVEATGTCLYVDCGNGPDFGQVLLGGCLSRKIVLPMPWEVCPELIADEQSVVDQPSCSLAEALHKQDLFINQDIATQALKMLWRIIRHGEVEYTAVYINQKSGKYATKS